MNARTDLNARPQIAWAGGVRAVTCNSARRHETSLGPEWPQT